MRNKKPVFLMLLFAVIAGTLWLGCLSGDDDGGPITPMNERTVEDLMKEHQEVDMSAFGSAEGPVPVEPNCPCAKGEALVKYTNPAGISKQWCVGVDSGLFKALQKRGASVCCYGSGPVDCTLPGSQDCFPFVCRDK